MTGWPDELLFRTVSVLGGHNWPMPEYCTITALVTPPAAAGNVLLTGAAELVADAILDLDLEMDHFQREVAQDGSGITRVKVELQDELPDQLARRIEISLANLIRETAELAGRTLPVTLAEAADDDQDEELDDGELEAEAERLLPSGDQIAASLLEDIRHERSVYAAANLFRAIPTENLSTEDLEGLRATEHAAARRRASALAGCLIYAAEIVIDELIDDVGSLRAQEDTEASAIEDTWILSQLPSRFTGC